MRKEEPPARRSIAAAKRKLSRKLLLHPGIAGVGIEEDEEGSEHIKVYLSKDSKQLLELVPESIDGYPVVAEVIGPIRPRLSTP